MLCGVKGFRSDTNYHVYRIDKSGYKSEYLEDNLGTDLALPLAELNHGLAIGPNGEFAMVSTTLKQVFVEKGFDTLAPPPGEFSLLGKNPDGSYTLTAKDGTVTEFNARGLMVSQTDRNNNAATYAYSAVERFISITDPVGRTTSFSYDINGKLEYILDPAERLTRFGHDAAGNLAVVTNPDNSAIAYSYDADHLLTTKTAPNGGIYTYAYNSMGRIENITDPEGGITQLDPGQMQGLINDIPAGEGTPDAPSSIISPDSILDLLIDANGDLNQNKTDADGALLEIMDALNNITSYERNSHHHPTMITNPNGSSTIMDYDLWGNLLTTLEEDISAVTTYTYEPNYNQVATITDPDDNVTTMEYDGSGNLIQTTDALGNVTINTYNARGQVTGTTNALNQTTTMDYDANGNLLTTTDPLDNTTTNTYDTAGNLVSTTDAEDRTTTYEYDAMNRLIEVTDADNNATAYDYAPGSRDTNANLLFITDANGNATTMMYDLLDRLVQTTNPGGFAKTYTYDENNNMLTSTDAKGQTISYEYDSLNRLLRKTLPDDEVKYLYDSMGNILGIRDSDSYVEMEYDTENRLTMANSFTRTSEIVTFSSDNTIGKTNTLFDGAPIVVDGATLTINGARSFVDVSIVNGGKITHKGATTTNENRLDLTVTGTLTIEAGSSIDVTGKGYLGGYQDDNLSDFGRTIGNTSTGASRSFSGASYGGLGGEYSGYTPNAVYGSLYNPDDLGSGGGSHGSFDNRGGNGGGLTRITCGTLNLNGNIRADGGTGGSWYNGGGSGGGIYIQAGTLTGGGAISANGGAGGNPGGGGGGGGGRIAVYYDDISGFDTMNITAYGATGLTANGGAGTIYLKSSAQSYGDLIVDNNNIATTVYSTPLPSVGTGTSTSLVADTLTDDTKSWRPGDLFGIYLNPDITQNSLFAILSNDDTSITTDINDGDITAVAATGDSYVGMHVFDYLYIKGAARIETADGIKAVNPTDPVNNIFEVDGMLKAHSLDAGGSELDISSGGLMTDITNQGGVNKITLTDSTMESGNRFVLNSLTLDNSTLTVYNDLDATTLTVDNGSELSVAGVIASDSISIANNSRLNHPAATTTGEYRLTVNTNTLSIDSGSVIDVSARGYLGGYQGDNLSEFGRTIGNTNTGASRSYSGASYGGLGGEYSGYTPNAVYGSLYNPDDLGSGGGSSGSVSYRGGNGGGLTRITCGTLNLNGNIRADGGTGGSWYNGGGSGGGIYIQAGTLTGGGAISVDGGNGGNPGGGGA